MEFESVEEVLGFLLDVNHQDNDMKVTTVNLMGLEVTLRKQLWKTIRNPIVKLCTHYATCLG